MHKHMLLIEMCPTKVMPVVEMSQLIKQCDWNTASSCSLVAVKVVEVS